VVARLAAWNGPGIVGLMPAGSARFVHDPAGGASIGARLTVTDLPALDHRKRAGPFTVAQQREELEQLAALQSAATAAPAVPAIAAAAATAAESADPVDKLAAWLLRQTDLSGV
jgi:N-acetylglucosamine kinase-like BadF-type ATPase